MPDAGTATGPDRADGTSREFLGAANRLVDALDAEELVLCAALACLDSPLRAVAELDARP
jgi:hypothetical protein